jgi:hypothetical protein
MIHNSFYLYPNKIDIFTDLLDPWVAERYRKVYNRNVKIYRGADARIDVQIKNCDQKPISTNGMYLVFNLVVKETQRLVIKKDFVSLVDGSTLLEKGRAYVMLTKEEMQRLEPGYYQYSVVIEERQYTEDQYRVISSRPTYVDSDFGAYATLEIFSDIQGEPQPSFEITEFTYVNPFAVGDSNPKYNISSIIDANPRTSTPYSSHTLQFFHSPDYVGTIKIQGSMDESTDPKTWIDLPGNSMEPAGNNYLTNGATTTYRNIIGKWKWLRVIVGASFNGTATFVIGQTTVGVYDVAVYSGGVEYRTGQELIITGDRLGGESGVNDLRIRVESVNYLGSITGISIIGTSILNTRSFVLGANGEPVTGTVDKILYR